MSRLHPWASRLLFVWQLLWLQVQAAQPRQLALNPDLLVSITLGATEPWPWGQQNPSYISEEAEPLSF